MLPLLNSIRMAKGSWSNKNKRDLYFVKVSCLGGGFDICCSLDRPSCDRHSLACFFLEKEHVATRAATASFLTKDVALLMSKSLDRPSCDLACFFLEKEKVATRAATASSLTNDVALLMSKSRAASFALRFWI